MKTRVISSLAGIALLLVILTAFHKVTFNIIAVIVYLISLWEIRGTFKEKNAATKYGSQKRCRSFSGYYKIL